MGYILNVENEFSDDINTVLEYINVNGYVIAGREFITKSKQAKKNIFHTLLADVSGDFDNGPKKVKEEFSRLFDVTGSIIENMGTNKDCGITRAIACNMPKDLLDQFNEVTRIEIDPCTYDKCRVDLRGNRIQMGDEEYRATFEAYLVDYNRRCAMYWEISDGKKVYPDKGMAFGAPAQFNPLMKTINYSHERAALKVIRKKLKFNDCELDDSIKLVKEYLTAMRVPESVDKFKNLNLSNDYQSIVAYVLLHWMWLVKRNLSDDPKTVEEIFVNIYGAQSSGKTTFVEDLSHALQYFFAEADVKKISDEREIKLFVNKRIIFFDEFGSKAKLSPEEMTALKKIITSDTIHQRQMHTTEFSVMRRKFTGISATNIPIGEIVKDESGARRYFEIITDTAYDKNDVTHFDFEYLDSKKHTEENGKSSYLDIWKVVDDSLDAGYISMDKTIREDIRKIQSTYVPLSSSVQFLTSEEYTYVDVHAIPTPEELKLKFSVDEYTEYGISDLYKRYTEWCKINNQDQAKTMGNFKRDIEELPILIRARKRSKNNDGTPRLQNFYYVFVASMSPVED
jgi:hypothetical protein